MLTIHLIRHGEVHNPTKVLYGRLPRFRLSETGRAQAAATATYLRDTPLAAVYCSPMLRARETAGIIAAEHPALDVKRTSLLNEVHLPYDGRPIAEMEAMDWIMYDPVLPGYESPADILARVRRWVKRVYRAYSGQEIAAISHGDVVLITRFWAEGLHFSDAAKSAIDPYPATASITTLTFTNGVERPDSAYHRPY